MILAYIYCLDEGLYKEIQAKLVLKLMGGGGGGGGKILWL